MRELGEAVLVPASDQRLAPRRDEDAEVVAGRRGDPIDEASPRGAVDGELLAAVLALRERTVRATVIAARERTAVQDVELHDSSYSAIRRRTSSENSHGPIASARARPSAVRRSCSPSR